jgi:hypothetical protein
MEPSHSQYEELKVQGQQIERATWCLFFDSLQERKKQLYFEVKTVPRLFDIRNDLNGHN